MKKQNKYWSKLYTLPSFWLAFFLSLISNYTEFEYFHWNLWNLLKDEFLSKSYHNPFDQYLLTCGALMVIELIIYYFSEKALEVKTLVFTKENPYGEKK